MSSWLAGGVFEDAPQDNHSALRELVREIGQRAHRMHRPGAVEFDRRLWRTLEDSDLTRLTSSHDPDAGAGELAVVLHGLSRQAIGEPVADTDLLAAWLADAAGLSVPQRGPLSVAIANGRIDDDRLHATSDAVPWARHVAALVLLARTADGYLAGVIDAGGARIEPARNLAGEPRDRVIIDVGVAELRRIDAARSRELIRRGAWARCIQILGTLDAAAELTVAHTRDRIQFGRPLKDFQTVQHALVAMAGDIERARVATTAAVAASCQHGFASAHTDFAVTTAKVVVGRVVPRVTTVGHQLHGAIGATAEHSLWQSTLRAQSWVGEFGSTRECATKLGRVALAHAGGRASLWEFLTKDTSVSPGTSGRQNNSP
ncbi:acyl-CoA dehydrogenase family protein [Mycobacterium vicinigordonae]|uniref:Acyl-CoA dehydrogenase n=1 Tax=Mycobacterium vicinigordonae TaxID=1719132 RepID=A0A7D6E8H1_9MYCO|nr:acyl-CoA dehydrogenase family protein [Mycobacterium vicinigordonae]QLL09103.1 acyl-CoA dehydrogenase [Mycobacterium vicinigordonae]